MLSNILYKYQIYNSYVMPLFYTSFGQKLGPKFSDKQTDVGTLTTSDRLVITKLIQQIHLETATAVLTKRGLILVSMTTLQDIREAEG